MDRLSGKSPVKRQYSVPEIARRIGVSLTSLKRVIRGQDEAPVALLTRLAKDLDIPLKELKSIADQGRPQSLQRPLPPLENGDTDHALRVLEEGLIASARALVQILRSCMEGNRGR